MLPEGTLLGRYRVDALAAVGGMGAVYRGTDTVLERAVALKVLPADRAGDPGMAERFRCESLQAAGLGHPNVLPVYDAGEAEGVSYVAMQWVDGMTLEQLVAEDGPLEVERAVAFTEAVAAALDHAHEQGIVHRDVKPGNVMVDGAGHAYLMDFGLSVRTDRTSALTKTGEFMATVDYAAPEQIQAAAIDRRADVYGLAGLAFRCLTGRVPFERESPVARMYAHVNDAPPVAHELRPAVPPAASETIRRGLAKHPDERPATAGAFAAELRAAIGAGDPGDTVALSVVPDEGEAAPGNRRVRRVLAGAAATVLAAFGGMSLAGVTGGGSPSGDLPAAGAGPRQERKAEQTTATGADGTATVPRATAESATAATKPKKDKAEKKDTKGERGAADGGLTGAGGGGGGETRSETPAPSPSAAPATQQQPSASPAPTSGSAPEQSQPSGGQTTTSTPPAETTPAQTTPAETTPTETTPAETTPTETTASEPEG